MALYLIAGLYVDMDPQCETMLTQGRKYLCDDDVKPDVTIRIPEDYLLDYMKLNPLLSRNDCEYMILGIVFYRALIEHGGFLLHSSAVVVDGKAYLFSAPSGTGKSTHTSLYLSHFGSRAYILNDDKPAIKLIDGKFYAFGTPFSGKTDTSVNTSVPLGGICMLGRGEKNEIHRIYGAEAVRSIMSQIYRPNDQVRMDMTLDLLSELIAKIPIYALKCNISDDAVVTSYGEMSKGAENL